MVAATGLGRGSLYGAFGDKHSLYVKALDGYVESMVEHNHHELRLADGSAKQRLTGHIRRLVQMTLADHNRRGCLVSKSAAELASSDREVAKHTKRMLDTWRRDLAATLAEAQADGDISAGRDTRALASLLLTLLRGMESTRTQGASTSVISTAGEQAIELVFDVSHA
ncbi:TetR/AcrR family transcriptional regulator [Mycolicibacterium baixiangningiae]|uniref:TetR/AcrR family transcriptional regulator n=1 Tax=Mycolicibacterium baixiangningiae TaxID=2761578 RepID=UPI001D009724|nr:TetR family transcriptional regulator C-terminal domain-containing protein [Mycolicibacterium baixiangningiae]